MKLTKAQLEFEVARLQAIVEDKLADTRLVSAGPKPDGGFGFDLTGGPIPYLAEYLFQFIGARDEYKPTSNYAEIEITHHEFGAMTLTLQRRSGQTPHELRRAAEAQRDKLAEALRGMVARFELYAGPNDMHAGHHDLALLSAAREALSNLEPKP